MKAACFTVAAMDYFPQIKEHYAGGNALNQAVRFRALGHESAFVGALGTDSAGSRILRLMADAGIDVSRARVLEGETARNEIVNDGKGERFGVEGAWSSGVYGEFRLSEEDWDFVSDFDVWATHANCADYAEATRRKRAKNFLAVDFLHFDTYELLEAGGDALDIAYFGGTREQLGDLVRLSKSFSGVIVLTLGAEGSVAIKGGKQWRQEALPIERVVDTTGCGDAFQAGFTARYFATRDVESALLSGATLGRVAALSHGGVPWTTAGVSAGNDATEAI